MLMMQALLAPPSSTGDRKSGAVPPGLRDCKEHPHTRLKSGAQLQTSFFASIFSCLLCCSYPRVGILRVVIRAAYTEKALRQG